MAQELRKYQLDLLSQVESDFERGSKSVVFTLATGAGKTGIAAIWLSRFDGMALFICPKLDVIGQMPDEFLKWGGNAIAVGSGYAKWEDVDQPSLMDRRKVIACSPQTVYNRLIKKGVSQKTGRPLISKWKHIKAIVIDEAHHAPSPLYKPKQVSKIIQVAKGLQIPIMGMTATLWRMSKREGFTPLWDSLIVGPNWADLRGEWLADVNLVKSNYSILGAGAASGMDYQESETHKANRRKAIYTDGVFDYASRYAKNPDGSWKKTIIFSVGQMHALNLCKSAKKRGIEVGLLVSSPSILDRAPRGVEIDRARVNERLRSGDLNMVINVNIVTEGYNLPDCECVICARPTLSVSLWKQICGRGSRKADGKDELVLVDLTDNTERLGDPFLRYKWSLLPRDNNVEVGPPIMRRCTPESPNDCENYLFVTQRTCKACGELQGKECDACGKFRLWEDYKESTSRCARCVAAAQHTLLQEKPDNSSDNRWLAVSQLRIAKTKHGDLYVSCILQDGRRANYFNSRMARQIQEWEPNLKNGLWVFVEGDYKSVEVRVKQKGRWLNVATMRLIEAEIGPTQ